MDEIETLKAKVAELEKTVEDLTAEKKEVETKNYQLLKDNKKQREDINTLKENSVSAEAALTEYKTKFEEANSTLTKIARESKLVPMLVAAGIKSEKAQKMALKELAELEEDKFEDGIKGLIEEYDFLVDKNQPKVVLPNTGGTNTNKDAVVADENLLSAGLAKALNK